MQDFIVSFVVWTLSRMHVSFHWQRTRLYLDNELLLFFGKTCTDERCNVNKLSELSFLKHVAPLTGSLESRFISTHQHSFQTHLLPAAVEIYIKAGKKEEKAVTVVLNEPAKACASLSHAFF